MARAYDPKNFDDAWRTDLPLIRELTRQEKQAEEDRALAARLAGITLNDIPDNTRKMAMLPDDYDDDDNVEVDNQLLTTTSHTSNQSKSKKCTACMESVRKTDPCTPCGHMYCLGCLKDLIMTSMQDESLMPPRCCRQEIPVALAKLTAKETQDFNAKRLEYSTPNRLYCSQPTCSAFIPPMSIVNSVGTCPKLHCRAKTCSICKGANHENEDCPKDEATAAVLETARQAGWTRCYRCRAIVELNQGCYHMTCRCRAEFCYLCSKPWKNCPCVQWEEARLIQEARVRTARILRIEVPGVNRGLNLEQRVQAMANQLRENHECQHTRGWRYTRGGGRCDECNDYLPRYLYRCYDCHFMACNRCRRNRL